jgi:hypothetical protein
VTLIPEGDFKKKAEMTAGALSAPFHFFFLGDWFTEEAAIKRKICDLLLWDRQLDKTCYALFSR